MNIEQIIKKVKKEMTLKHGYDFKSDFFDDEIFILVIDTIIATIEVIKNEKL